MSDWFTIEDTGGGITKLTLHHAPVNALTSAFLDALNDAYNLLGSDPDVRAVILSSGLNVMSAGVDLKQAQAFDKDAQAEIVRALNQSFVTLYSLPKPTIAAVNGAAIAGGFFFVLGCDYRIASTTASMGLAEVRAGVTLPAGPLEIARAELKAADFRHLLLGGKPCTAPVALATGIVDEVVDARQLMDRASAVARDYAALPPITYSRSKHHLRAAVAERVKQAIKSNANTPAPDWFCEETKSAMAALLAK